MYRFVTLLAVMFMLPSVTTMADQQEEEHADGSGIGHIGLEELPVFDVAFHSDSLDREMHINVVLPRGYARGLDEKSTIAGWTG